jgi:1-acyl-sn-glycerol-3-phosphate acyltransferase
MIGSLHWAGGDVALTGSELPSGGAILAVHHVRHDDAVLVRAAVRQAGRPRPWLGLVIPTRALPWGISARSRALTALRRGELVVIFPEVAVAPDRGVFKGDVEVAHLALEAGVPVLPAVISEDRTQVRIGDALDFSRHADTPHSRAVLRAVTDEVMEAVAILAGLPYRDVPASAARQEAADAKREQIRAERARREADRQNAALERQEARARAAAEEADLAQAAIRAREEAKLQARRAALADQLRAAGIHPGVHSDTDESDTDEDEG